MTREELQHILQAAAKVVRQDQFVIVGSQAIIWQAEELPELMTTSMEVDIYPRDAPELADEIDGSLGEGSMFHEMYGYWAHGVGPETPVAPDGWQMRLIAVTLPQFHTEDAYVTAWLLEAHDLVLAKLAAGRSRDFEYASAAILAGIVSLAKLKERLERMPDTHREIVRERLETVRARLP